MHLQELKQKSPADLLAYAEELEVENASTLRKQDMMFAILKQLANNDVAIYGSGVLEVLSDGFGFLRAPESNYLPGPDDIYVSPSQVRRFGLRTGDTVEGEIRAPKDGERYFALLKVETINFEETKTYEALLEMTGGIGPDACIDAVGLEAHGFFADNVWDQIKV
ncbi:MAG: Rho termination factor N-terminal domain-containing protein, partial [Pseudomonadota bacterium]|nr:Rho termination factor N-terminal domain-containing protein [Pseudomonadota bacterium]